MKTRNLFFLSVLLVLFQSCGQDSGHQSTQDDLFRVLLITDVGGMGDKGFNDAGWAGCEDAKRRLLELGEEIDIDVIESREQTDYEDNLTFAAERADVIVALGFLIADAVEEVAKDFPDTAFVFIDGSIEGENIASFEFRSQEAAFLAGILASHVTKTGVISVLPGMDIPPVEAFASGYQAGAKTADALLEKEIRVLSSTIGSFNDPVKAKSVASSLMNRDADVLFQLAGNSGLGVLEAIKESSQDDYMIGVDINQDDLAPGKVLTSVLKRMDRVVSDQIVAVYEDRFESGIFHVGLDDGYVGLTEMEYTRDQVPEEAFEHIERAKEMIIQGEITVPGNYEDLQNFEPPVDVMKSS